MKNPWLQIPSSDYENHMEQVGQSQLLNTLFAVYLSKYRPENVALIGCSTGNGLEHIDNEIQKHVYAVDINNDYLEVLNHRFSSKIQGLHISNIDLENDELNIKGMDLVFMGLVLEYVSPAKVLHKIANILRVEGKLIIVIQKNRNTSFVSKTKYKSLELLADFHNDVLENDIEKIIRELHLNVISKNEIQINEGKSFVLFEIKKL